MDPLTEHAVTALDAITGADPEIAHSLADDVLLLVVPDEVREAYVRVQSRCAWWACA